METIYFNVWQSDIERIKIYLHLVFIPLEKACTKMPRKIFMKSSKKGRD